MSTVRPRAVSIALATAEMACLAEHVAALTSICHEGAMPEWAPGVEQLRLAIDRVMTDIAATRAARLQ